MRFPDQSGKGPCKQLKSTLDARLVERLARQPGSAVAMMLRGGAIASDARRINRTS